MNKKINYVTFLNLIFFLFHSFESWKSHLKNGDVSVIPILFWHFTEIAQLQIVQICPIFFVLFASCQIAILCCDGARVDKYDLLKMSVQTLACTNNLLYLNKFYLWGDSCNRFQYFVVSENLCKYITWCTLFRVLTCVLISKFENGTYFLIWVCSSRWLR